MSVLLALPQSIAMRSPPSGLDADYQSNKKQRGERPLSNQTGRSPAILRKALGGRVSRPKSSPFLSLSLRNQQYLWESATGRTWQPEEVEPLHECIQSLQYITPQSLSTSPVPSVAPTSPAISLEAVPAAVTPVISADPPLDPQGLLSSLEFVIPQQYNHFGTYPSSYTSSYMDPYSNIKQEGASPQASSPHAVYYSSRTPAAEGSPAHSPAVDLGSRDAAHSYQYSHPVRPAYDTSAATSSPYSYTQTPSSSYAPTYASSHNPYAGSQYSVGYSQHASAYLPHPSTGYSSNAYSSAPSYHSLSGAQGERIANPNHAGEKEWKCWEASHGGDCQHGKKFSTLSNLLRHKREKQGQNAKAECSKCGVVFTRKTARDSHELHDKCNRKRTTSFNQ